MAGEVAPYPQCPSATGIADIRAIGRHLDSLRYNKVRGTQQTSGRLIHTVLTLVFIDGARQAWGKARGRATRKSSYPGFEAVRIL